jgi:hypothetical protein
MLLPLVDLHLGTEASLVIILSILAISIIASLLRKSK